MDNPIGDIFLDSSKKKLQQMAKHIQACLGRLQDEQLWSRGGTNENAIGNLILHICGNARQWMVSGVGGAQDVRDRDAEFAARGNWSRDQLSAHLKQTVDDSMAALESVKPARLAEMMTAQGHTVPVMEGIYRVVVHFVEHTGQIVFATKILTGEDLGLVRPKK